MKTARKHTEDEVLNSLRKKHDVRVRESEKSIFVLNGLSNKPQFQKANDLGNKSWGKIDYLRHYKGYVLYTCSEFPKDLLFQEKRY